jgi:hypothetical protein
VDVGDREALLERLALEPQAQQAPKGALRSVGADQERGLDAVPRPVIVADLQTQIQPPSQPAFP